MQSLYNEAADIVFFFHLCSQYFYVLSVMYKIIDEVEVTMKTESNFMDEF